jgi:hypothetical protein
MTALTTLTIRKQGEVTPFCEMPNCTTTGKADFPSYANAQMFLLGHPIGWFCRKHAKEIRAAYDSAHGTFEPMEIAA